jgi:hypothetical protein
VARGWTWLAEGLIRIGPVPRLLHVPWEPSALDIIAVDGATCPSCCGQSPKPAALPLCKTTPIQTRKGRNSCHPCPDSCINYDCTSHNPRMTCLALSQRKGPEIRPRATSRSLKLPGCALSWQCTCFTEDWGPEGGTCPWAHCKLVTSLERFLPSG